MLAGRGRPPAETSPARSSGSVSDSTIDAADVSCARGSGPGALPPLFAGRTFTLHAALPPQLDAALLRRYVRAYGGLVLEVSPGGVPRIASSPAQPCRSQATDDAQPDFVLGATGGEGDGGGGVSVRADWVWRCHELRALASRP